VDREVRAGPARKEATEELARKARTRGKTIVVARSIPRSGCLDVLLVRVGAEGVVTEDLADLVAQGELVAPVDR
jgi:hypothetical protein